MAIISIVIARVFLDLTFQVSSSVVIDLFFVYSSIVTRNTSRDWKKQYAASHTVELKGESVALKALLKASLCAICDFSGKVVANTWVLILQIHGLSSGTTGSVTTVLPHSAIVT